jgi:hypothetical protein
MTGGNAHSGSGSGGHGGRGGGGGGRREQGIVAVDDDDDGATTSTTTSADRPLTGVGAHGRRSSGREAAGLGEGALADDGAGGHLAEVRKVSWPKLKRALSWLLMSRLAVPAREFVATSSRIPAALASSGSLSRKKVSLSLKDLLATSGVLMVELFKDIGRPLAPQ